MIHSHDSSYLSVLSLIFAPAHLKLTSFYTGHLKLLKFLKVS